MEVGRVASLFVPSSASALPNNLVVRHVCGQKDAVAVAVVHRSVANIVSTPIAPSHLAHNSKVSCVGGTCTHAASIMQVAFIETEKRTYFVVASTFGVQIFDEGGSAILFSHAVGVSASHREQGSYARGIAKLEANVDGDLLTWICVGTHLGVILVFAVADLDISLSIAVQAHAYSITALIGVGCFLISSDDSGALQSWKLNVKNGKLKQQASKAICNWSCTTLAVFKEGGNHKVLAGFGSGHLRVYEDDLELCVEVAAHVRSISSVDISAATLLCVSASEDSLFRLWQLQFSSQPITLLQSFSIPHEMIMGAKFLTAMGSLLGLSCYDSSEIFIFEVKNVIKE